MHFTIRPFRRIPLCCPVAYQVEQFEGFGMVWNVTPMGWRFSGDLPLRVGEVCSLTVTLPTHQEIYVAAAIVRWVRAEEYGVETLVIDAESREDLDQFLSEWTAEAPGADG
ncbi:protein of unknown function [Nitrospira japonica]|uniref:PilZ domain-containing protein n=1 Tax=Nitrospira japonica TaxID=1325564 RepID=A0A1W1I1D3_9BACT|nr:PilZ domain-containing protein [Nitrospira japonica]SLM46794.1 protein of unknown function [Nitrospira japonica]